MFDRILEDQETTITERQPDGCSSFLFRSLDERLFQNIHISIVLRICYDEKTDLGNTEHRVRSSHIRWSLEHWLASIFSEAHMPRFWNAFIRWPVHSNKWFTIRIESSRSSEGRSWTKSIDSWNPARSSRAISMWATGMLISFTNNRCSKISSIC
jgi:hypothetical protein